MFGENGYSKVFFSITQTKEFVSSESPIEIGGGEIYSLLADFAQKPKNFIGFIDQQDTTIQFMVDEFDKIWVDIPSVENKGSYGKHMNNEEMLKLINDLSEPYSKYIKDLNLTFTQW